MVKWIKLFIIPIASVLLVGCESTQKEKETDNTIASSDSTAYRGCNSIVTENPYDIPAQRFDETAQQLAHASGCFIETDLSKTGAIQVNAVKGKMSIRDAVLMAIRNTELEMKEEISEILVIGLLDSLNTDSD